MGVLLDGGGCAVPMKIAFSCVLGAILTCSLSLLAALPADALPPVPDPAPAVITVPDCGDGFTMDVRPRRNPEALGTVTRDGYPVLLDRRGENHYILSRGADIPVPVVRRGFPLPDCVPGGER